MHAFLSLRRGLPLLLIHEYSVINKEQRIHDRSKTAHRKPPVKRFLTRGNYRPWEQTQAWTKNYLTLKWPPHAHSNSREIYKYILTIITFLNFFKKNYFFISPLTFIFISITFLKKNCLLKTNSIYISFNFCNLLSVAFFILCFW